MNMSNFSIWEKEAFFADADIVIVGAGFMGLWTAIEVKKSRPQLNVLVVERNTTSLGASTRNAGFACFGSPTELLSDIETMGKDAMLQQIENRYKGIQKIRKNFSDSTLHFDPCGGFECFDNDISELENKLHCLNKDLYGITGDAATFQQNKDLLSHFRLTCFTSIIQNKLEGSLHSGYYLKALTQKAQLLGVDILFGFKIIEWNSYENFVEVLAEEGKLHCKTLVFCTNAFSNDLIKGIKMSPARGQVILTSAIENLPLKGTFHFDEGFYYWRNLGNRILLGGARNIAFEDEETTELSITKTIQDKLESFLEKHLALNCIYTIEHRWAGIMAFTDDKQPMLHSVSDNVFAAVACNGMGVSLTPIWAENVASTILGNF